MTSGLILIAVWGVVTFYVLDLVEKAVKYCRLMKKRYPEHDARRMLGLMAVIGLAGFFLSCILVHLASNHWGEAGQGHAQVAPSEDHFTHYT